MPGQDTHVGRSLPLWTSQDFVGIEEQQDLWMAVALKLEIYKGACEDTGNGGRGGNSQ